MAQKNKEGSITLNNGMTVSLVNPKSNLWVRNEHVGNIVNLVVRHPDGSEGAIQVVGVSKKVGASDNSSPHGSHVKLFALVGKPLELRGCIFDDNPSFSPSDLTSVTVGNSHPKYQVTCNGLLQHIDLYLLPAEKKE